MGLPRITVITPSFNQAQYLETTINSVLDQGYHNLEYMIFDGGSSDGSLEIIKKYEKHLAHWESQSDKGQSDAINKGLKKTTGDIINWLNSDDFYEPNALFTIAESFSNPEVTALCGRSNIVDGGGRVVGYTQGTDIYAGNLAKTIGWARIDQPETFFRKVALDEMGFLNPDLHYVMDKDWWIRYLIKFGLKGINTIDDVLVNFRIHSQSKTSTEAQSFIRETNTLYAEMCQANGLSNWRGIIDRMGISEKIDLNYSKTPVAEAVIQYYLLYKADRSYYIGDHELSKLLLDVIDSTHLSPQDQILLRNLKLKSKLVPGWFRKFIKSTYV